MEKSSLVFENSLKFQPLPNGETIAYRSQLHPSAETNVVLLHGWICSSLCIWDDLILLLSDLPINFYALDMRGFGDSTYNKTIESMEDFAADINLFVKALNLKNIILAGYSMGGAVTLLYAANYPENLLKIILFDSVGCGGVKIFYEKDGVNVQIIKSDDFGKSPFWMFAAMKWDRNTAGAIEFEKLGTFNCGKMPTAEQLEKYVEGFKKERHVADAIYWMTNFNISTENNGIVEGNEKIKKIKCKCLFLHGEKDLLIEVKESEKSAEAIGKLARVQIVENSGHCPFMSNTEKTAEFVREFLNEK